MKTKNPIRQAIVDLIGPNLPSVVQFIIKNATNAPKIPKIAVEAPTVNVFGLHSTLNIKPKYPIVITCN